MRQGIELRRDHNGYSFTRLIPARLFYSACIGFWCLHVVAAGLLSPAHAGITEDWARLSGGAAGKLAYTRPAGSNQAGSGLYVMDLSTGSERKVADIEFPKSHYCLAGSIQWSFDGTKLTVQTIEGVYVLNEDGSNLETVWSGTIRTCNNIVEALISHSWTSDNEIVYSTGKKIVKTTIDGDNAKIMTRDVIVTPPAGCAYVSIGMSGNFVAYIDDQANRHTGGWHRPMVVNVSTGERWKMVADNSDGCQLSLKPDGQGTVMWCRLDHSKLLVNKFKNGTPFHTYSPFNDGIQIPNWSNDEGFITHMGGRVDPVGAWIRRSYSDDNVNLGGDILLPDLFVGEGIAPSDPTPPSAPSNLSATTAGTTTITLHWDEASDAESGISSYNVYRNGEKVGSTDNTSYTDEGLSEGTTYKYRVSAVNGEGTEGEKSNESSATTAADNDTSPPEPTAAIAQSATSVKVSFNEPITGESAENTGNYSIGGGITVSGASLQGDNRSVVLTTSMLTEKTSYTLTVSNITDRSPNANTGGGQVDFTLSGEVQIGNLSVASGKAYEIVEPIAEGDKQFIDRDFTWESLGDLAGMTYIRTANDDKAEGGESFLSFDINTGATIYVAYRHAGNLPPWLSSWSRTGKQVCGDGCSEVYEKDFGAGTVTLGGNMPGGAGNMYSVFVEAGGGGTMIDSPGFRAGTSPAAPIRTRLSGATLRLTGFSPGRTCAVTLTDTRGRVWSVRGTAGSNGEIRVSTARLSRGVYVVRIPASREWTGRITVLRGTGNGSP